MKQSRLTAALAAAAAGVVLLAGCSSPENVATPEPDGPTVGVVVANAFGDRSFYDIALKAEEPLKSELGATMNTYEARLEADKYVPLLGDAGRQNDYVFVLGFEMLDALNEAAAQNPDAVFIFLDSTVDNPAVSSVAYRDSEGCFLAGALAALATDAGLPGAASTDTVGFVGGMDIPVIRDCQSGYSQGAVAAVPGITVLSATVGDFNDPAKGKAINESLTGQGSAVNYQYAGLSGEGGFDAAKSGDGSYVIGAGLDQSFLAPDGTLGSMVKNIDSTILAVTKGLLDGSLEPGFSITEGLAEGGLGMVYSDALISAQLIALIDALRERITSGDIVVESDRG